MVYTEIFFANELVSGLGKAGVWTFDPPRLLIAYCNEIY